jgi:hypothetical protein
MVGETMTRKLILEGWNSYRREVIPSDAPAIQIEECRRAFYAGAVHLFFDLQRIMDPASPDPTEAEVRQMQEILHEITASAREMTELVMRRKR